MVQRARKRGVSLRSSLERSSWKPGSPAPRPTEVSRGRRRPLRGYQPDANARHPTVVWIDDYEPGLVLYKAVFEDLGFRVLTASRGSVGLDLVASHPADAVVVDYEMPGMNGEAVATSIRHSRPELPIIMFSGSSMLPNRVRNVVDAVCDKAGSRDELLATIHRVLGKQDRSRPAPSKAEHALRVVA